MTSHRLLWIDERKAVGLQLSLATVENVSCIVNPKKKKILHQFVDKVKLYRMAFWHLRLN